MNLISIAAAAILVLTTVSEAAPSTKTRQQSSTTKAKQLPGLSNIKHVVYFMQVRIQHGQVKIFKLSNLLHFIGKPFV
jgi:hypothetical protein